MSASKDARPRKRVDCEILHRLERRTKHFFYKSVETSPQMTCFKNHERKLKGKAKKGQYLLAVDLGYYKWYQS